MQRYGVAFPDRPPNSPPILTPSRLSTTSPRYYQPPYDSTSNSSRSLNEVMASDVANLRWFPVHINASFLMLFPTVSKISFLYDIFT